MIKKTKEVLYSANNLLYSYESFVGKNEVK